MNINGYVMSKDMIVFEIQDGKIINKDLNKCPLYFKDNDSFENWIKTRAVDNSRVNSRLLKKALGIKDISDFNTVIYNYAVNITDNYWFKEKNSNLSWDDVRFTDNSFFNLSLYGDTSDFNKEPSRTPELTSIGSFDKGWKKENNEWWLYKVADDNQKYSEWLISEVGSKLLGFDMAYYVMNDDNTIKTLDFTENNKYNYEPMFSLIGANNDYNDNFNLLLNIDNNLAISYLKILYADTLFQNMDRHTFNYGILRDPNTGQILKLAPNFDNNVALIYKGKLPSVDLPLIDNDLYDLLDQNATAVLMLNNINIPVINKDDLSKITNNIETSVDKDYLNDYIIKHQKMINDKIAYYKTNSNAFKK